MTEGELLKRIVHLEKEIETLSEQLEKQNSENEEIVFTLNGVKLDRQSQKQQYEQSIQERENVIRKLEKNLEHLHVKHTKLEATCEKMEKELEETIDHLNAAKVELAALEANTQEKISEL